MNITILSDQEVGVYLAARIRAERLRLGYSQASFAEKAGIPLRTYKRIELSGAGNIENLIRILRTLGRIRAVEILLPPPVTKMRIGAVERIKKIAKSKNNL